MLPEVAPLFGGVMDRATFVRRLVLIAGNPTALWLPHGGDLTTNVMFPDTRTWTHAVSQAARFRPQGNGVLVTFDGSNDYIVTPDTAGMSPGNASVDTPLSVVCVGNITASGATALIIDKGITSTGEWGFYKNTTNGLRLQIQDGSVPAAAFRTSDAAIPTALTMLGGTYTAATGGATAANDMALYVHGLAVASTATNGGTYVAMENSAFENAIGGAASSHGSNLAGTLGLVIVYVGVALSAAQHLAIRNLASEFFGAQL